MRGDPQHQDSGGEHRVYGTKKNASFQVIILGCNGGPREDTITGLLVRAPQSEWRKNSLIAVDAGVHLASIMNILQSYMPYRSDKVAEPGYSKLLEKGPFAGLRFPHYSAKANALYIFRELLHSFLITHPHLDHIAAMGVNTPALEFGREAKAIVALPPTIEAIKTHIFNDTIWPNLSDENHGVGFVTYRRLTEGGNQRLGPGDARGYVSVCDGLAVKCLAVTHGKCQRHSRSMSHQRGESSGWFPNDYTFPPRRTSRMSDDHAGYFAAIAQQQAYSASMHTGGQMQMPPGPMTPGISGGPGSIAGDKDPHSEPVTSSAFFIRNDVTGKEILIFGDIEPDSVSISPRNCLVWDEAAPKIVNGLLKTIFIECSYDDSVRDSDLFGHLCPRHLVAELHNLAKRVMSHRDRRSETPRQSSVMSPAATNMNLTEPPSQADLTRKRKRGINGDALNIDTEASPRLRPSEPPLFSSNQYVGTRSTSASNRRTSRESALVGHSPIQRPITPSRAARHVQFQGSPRLHHGFSQSVPEDVIMPSAVGSTAPIPHPPPLSNQSSGQMLSAIGEPEIREPLPEPLKGVTIHIIHVKDTMVDGISPGEIIAEELKSHAAELDLGCDFDVTDCAESIWI